MKPGTFVAIVVAVLAIVFVYNNSRRTTLPQRTTLEEVGDEAGETVERAGDFIKDSTN
jgi:hypothetical protein